jgi:hypothetical protein
MEKPKMSLFTEAISHEVLIKTVPKSMIYTDDEQIKSLEKFIVDKSRSRGFVCLIRSENKDSAVALTKDLNNNQYYKITGPFQQDDDWIIGVEVKILFEEIKSTLEPLRKESGKHSCNLYYWMIRVDKKPQ